jgi:LysM repeat protein
MKEGRLNKTGYIAAHNMRASQNCVQGFVFRYFNLRNLVFAGLLFRFMIPLPLRAQQKNTTFENYIKQYGHLAIQEEKKHHIPASITLAQALLESAAGQSTLAQNSNNHFGIKCHEGWKGKRVYKNAEKPGECFRKYNSVKDSYADHSLFLTSRPRYEPLFRMNKNDYIRWARGLQHYGYATDRQYANKLIRLIETYRLNRYDGKNPKTAVPEEPEAKEEQHVVSQIHGLNCVVAGRGDTFESLARALGMKAGLLAKFNEVSVDFPLRQGDHIYLEKKRKKAVKPYFNHQVQSGESMYSISQRYGLRMKNLYKMNRKNEDFVPEVGEMLKLR